MQNKTSLEKFVESKSDWNDKQIQLAQLYELTLINEKAERNRSNISTLVWLLIALPILTILFLIGLGLGSYSI